MRIAHFSARLAPALVARAAAVIAVVALCFAANSARADFTINLTAAGSSDTTHGNGGLFYQADPHPTGSGFIDSFVRVGSNDPTEKGYNTDGQLEFDTKGGAFTHSLLLSSLGVTNIGGTDYYKFMLDINQTKASPILSINDIQIFLGDSGSLSGFGTTAFTNHAYKVYDVDGGSSGNVTVNLDYSLNSGSGGGDMALYIRAANFTGPNQYVYLYSSFGVPNSNNDGYEEWWAQSGTGGHVLNPVPAPASALLLLTGVPSLALTRVWRRRAARA